VVDSDAGGKGQSRPPTLEDLLHICGELNRAGAKYIVIGGMAIIHLGFTRATEDIDLLVEASSENQSRIRQALMTLPDQSVRDMTAADLDDYRVVRVADEIVVDLMKEACGVGYSGASSSIEWAIIEGVPIPFAGAGLLWKLKQAPRAKDEVDRSFLCALLGIEEPRS
jgi:Nucleotidyl transferase AbiEii toxin, Type IV TA system